MVNRQSRNVSLTPEFEGFISDSLASGNYANASEVVRAALRCL
jgi:putative addiction module CopG family antidote